MITRDQELWAIALWVEREHSADGWFYIAQQQDRLLAAGDSVGVAMWRKVGEHFELLRNGTGIGEDLGPSIQ